MEWDDMKVAELKQECSARGLSTSGRKADLLARLKNSTIPAEVVTELTAELVIESEPRWRRATAMVFALPLPVFIVVGILLSSTVLVALIQPAFIMNLFEDEIEYDLIDFDQDRARGFAEALVGHGNPGRHSGSAQEGAAADMILDNFTAMGFQATLETFSVPMFEIMDDPQIRICSPGNVPIWSSVAPCGPGDVGQQVTTFEHRIDYVLQGWSGSGDIQFNDGIEVVDMGNGSGDWGMATNKVAMVRLESVGFAGNSELYGKAAEADVAALILWNGVYNCGKVEADDCVPIFKGVDIEVVKEKAGGALPGDIPFMMVSDNTGSELYERLINGTDLLSIYTDVDNLGERDVRVPCGTWWGSGEEIVMVGAHHDTVYNGPGAVDDTSGTASVLEMAYQFASIATEKGEPKRTVRFCTWGGEEEGLWGSTAWVEAHRSELADYLRLYVNLDMNHADKDLAERGNSLTLFGNNKEDMDHIKSITKQYQQERSAIAGKYDIRHNLMPGEEGEPDSLPGNSDHAPFAYNLEERRGDVLVCYGSGSWEYHTYKDNMDRFNEESLGVSVVIYGTYVVHLAYGG